MGLLFIWDIWDFFFFQTLNHVCNAQAHSLKVFPSQKCFTLSLTSRGFYDAHEYFIVFILLLLIQYFHLFTSTFTVSCFSFVCFQQLNCPVRRPSSDPNLFGSLQFSLIYSYILFCSANACNRQSSAIPLRISHFHFFPIRNNRPAVVLEHMLNYRIHSVFTVDSRNETATLILKSIASDFQT